MVRVAGARIGSLDLEPLVGKVSSTLTLGANIAFRSDWPTFGAVDMRSDGLRHLATFGNSIVEHTSAWRVLLCRRERIFSVFPPGVIAII